MKKAVSLILALFIFALSSCAPAIKEISGTTFYFKEYGANYRVCPKNLEVKSVGEKIGESDSGMVFYAINGAEDKSFVTTGDESFTRIFAREGTDYPVLSDFVEPEIFICAMADSGYITPMTYVEDASAMLESIKNAMTGEEVSLPIGGGSDIHAIRLESEKVPLFYYYLWVYATPKGEYIISDEGTGKNYIAGDIFKGYL